VYICYSKKKQVLKLRNITIFIILIILADQALKFYIKLNYELNEEHKMAGNWARLHFVENSGMAWGMQIWGGDTGKLILTIFRFFACIFGVYYIRKIVKERQHKGFIICVGLIFAGAVGNLIDSMFYGLWFDKGMHWDAAKQNLVYYDGVAKLGGSYTGFLKGSVVDMFYFPIFKGQWPNWLAQYIGKDFEFFSPVFNLADAAISSGIITILLFQGKFFAKKNEVNHPTIETNSNVNDSAQVL
jgi:signal peptidase II